MEYGILDGKFASELRRMPEAEDVWRMIAISQRLSGAFEKFEKALETHGKLPVDEELREIVVDLFIAQI